MLDFSSDPKTRVRGYIDTMRAFDGDPAYPGYGRIVIREDNGTFRHCAIGIVVREYFSITPERMLETWADGEALDAHKLICEDLAEIGLKRNFITARHDWQHMPLKQIADDLESALELVA